MADHKSLTPIIEEDEGEVEDHHVLAPRQIIRNCLTDALKKTLVDLESQLSAIVAIPQSNAQVLFEFDKRLKKEEKFHHWESKELMIWDSSPVEASKYLKGIEEIHSLIETIGGLSADEHGKLKKDLLYRANSVLQLAMSRLEEELVRILLQYKQCVDPGPMSFRLFGADQVVYDEFSLASIDEGSSEVSSERNSNSNESEDYVVDLVHPLGMPHLKSIANVMFATNYGDEFCQAFINTRKEAFNEYLLDVLGWQKFSIEDVHKMEWTNLNSEIKKWNWLMKIVVRVYLASEKRLCEKILGEFGSFSSFCFLETTMDTMGCLLNFGVAIAIGARSPEKLFSFLDMYNVIANLRNYIDALFIEDAGCAIRNQFHEILKSLGNLAKTTFVDFGNVIASNTSANPFSGGGIHPLTRYVMNFIKTVTDYGDTLNLLLKDQHIEGSITEIEFEDKKGSSSSTLTPTSLHVMSITGILKSNLENRSKLYNDEALQHVFMMNNLHYMVQKIKNIKLELLFGDEWIRTQKSKVQQHVKDYVRATWSSAVSLLRDDFRVSHSLSKRSSKSRCKAFTNAFEEVYRTQTGWYVPDLELREDLQISTSQNVIPAYRNFVERVSVKFKITDKYMKYTVDDLEKHLFDLFEGSRRLLNKSFTCRK
ncbi:exocyst complex component EXO70E2-like [Rosa rugosa]|uniref:exocyst complex component EXO70E2-like n=1 Tax=Rosa rugosa TaxID=74645 RepID=UPI002B4127A2|nr:exocyst complex component EXO70E2-like [Rosa rugosa]